MARVIVPLCLLLLVNVGAHAQSPFAAGNEAYQRGDYVTAQQQYLGALGSGRATPALLYNLGNTCFRLQQLGWAILYYERALLATPRDADLRANLATAIASRHTPPMTDAPGWIHVILRAVLDTFTLNELALVATLLYFTACGLLFWRLRARSFRRRYEWLLYTALALAILLIGLTAAKSGSDYDRSRAVIVADGTIMSGPADNFQIVRKVYQGEMAHLVSEQGVWRQVRLETGSTGWLSQSMVEPIVR